MGRWKLAILDWNGTCLNDLPVVYKSVVAIFRHYGLEPPTLEQYRREITADYMKFYHKHGIPARVTGSDLKKIRVRVFREYWAKVKLRRDVFPLIRGLRRIKIKTTIVSAEYPSVLAERLAQFKIVSLLDCARAGAWPKDKALREMISRFNLKPDAAFYVDDTFDGIKSAKSVGLTTFGFTKGYNSRRRIQAAKPDFVVNSLKEVLMIIEKSEDDRGGDTGLAANKKKKRRAAS